MRYYICVHIKCDPPVSLKLVSIMICSLSKEGHTSILIHCSWAASWPVGTEANPRSAYWIPAASRTSWSLDSDCPNDGEFLLHLWNTLNSGVDIHSESTTSFLFKVSGVQEPHCKPVNAPCTSAHWLTDDVLYLWQDQAQSLERLEPLKKKKCPLEKKLESITLHIILMLYTTAL